MKKPATQADLDAANAEVRAVMDQNAVLKKEAADSYAKGYRDALHVAQDLTHINKAQAALIAFYLRLVCDGITLNR